MDRKKIVKALLFPHIAIMIILLPIATAFLVYSLVFMGSDFIIAIMFYVLAFYTLMIWTLKVPYIIKFFKHFKEENKYARRWQDDDRLRVNVSLYGTLIWNTAYALLQLESYSTDCFGHCMDCRVFLPSCVRYSSFETSI